MNQPAVLQPLKTWSHLAARRRKPSEYEIVSTNLHYTTDRPDAPFELDPNFPLAIWFKTHRNGSPLKHADWNAFRDPDEIVYRTYNMLQDGQENYVYGLFDQFSARGHDAMLEHGWARHLARLYTPARYLFHTLQMGSAYLCQIAPASTISNCATYQTADTLRWLTHTAYRTKELSKSFDDLGFGTGRARQVGDRSGLAGLPRTGREGPRRLRLGGRLRRDEPRRPSGGRGGGPARPRRVGAPQRRHAARPSHRRPTRRRRPASTLVERARQARARRGRQQGGARRLGRQMGPRSATPRSTPIAPIFPTRRARRTRRKRPAPRCARGWGCNGRRLEREGRRLAARGARDSRPPSPTEADKEP